MDMTALNLTARNLKVFGRNRIRRKMILNASGKKERGKMNRHGRILMNPGRGHMKDITANRKRIIKEHITKIDSKTTLIMAGSRTMEPQAIKKMNSMTLYHFMGCQYHSHRTS